MFKSDQVYGYVSAGAPATIFLLAVSD